MTEALVDELDEEEVLDDAWDAPAEIVADVDLDAVAELGEGEIVVSAFAGIGGIDVGFERAGFQTGVQIEWDAAASRVLAARFPHAVRFGDVRTVDGDAVRHALAGRRCRVLVGGFPCQDLSVAGSRAGMAGARSGLYAELLRLAQELDPDWLVVENVPGLLSADADPEANDGEGVGKGSGFALFLGDLTGFYGAVPEQGWRSSGVCHGPLGTCAWRVLDARHAGVAQRRRRVFVVFCPRDRVAPAAVLLEPEGVRRDHASRVPSWSRAAAAAVDPALRGSGAAAEPTGAGLARSPNGVEAVSALTSSLGKGGPDAAHALAGWMVPAEKMPSGLPMSARVELGETAPTLMAHHSEMPMILDRRGEDERHGEHERHEQPVTATEHGFAAWSESDVSGPLEARGAKSPKTVVATSVAMRGREGSTMAELGESEVSNTLRAGDGGSSRQPLVLVEEYSPETAATLTAGTSSPGVSPPGRRQEDDLNLVTHHAYRKSRRAATSEDDETWIEADHANTLNTFDGGDTRATEVVVEAFIVEPENGQGADLRARETDHSPALTAMDGRMHDRGVRIATNAAVRRLTPMECERLMGLEDGWTDIPGTSDSARYRQLGNAVVANVAEWIACRIADYIDGLLWVA